MLEMPHDVAHVNVTHGYIQHLHVGNAVMASIDVVFENREVSREFVSIG
jgi:hypothetical protein